MKRLTAMQPMMTLRSGLWIVSFWLVAALMSAQAQNSIARKSGQAASAESPKVLPGFKVKLLRSSQPGEGSWVSITVDGKGRLIVSPQDKEPMLRFTIGTNGAIAKIETLAVPV